MQIPDITRISTYFHVFPKHNQRGLVPTTQAVPRTMPSYPPLYGGGASAEAGGGAGKQVLASVPDYYVILYDYYSSTEMPRYPKP